MTNTYFAGQGIDLNGLVLPETGQGVSASTPAREDYNTLVDPYVHVLPRPEHEKLVDLALKHGITPTAMRELVTAAMDAKDEGLAAAARYGAAPAGGSKPSASNQAHASFKTESFSEGFRESEPDIYTDANGKATRASYDEFRKRFKDMWDSVRSFSQKDLAKHGTTEVEELKKLAEQYRKSFRFYEPFTGDMVKDLIDMERVINNMNLSPWKRFVHRLTGTLTA